MMLDAADAIEALQAELGKEGKRVEHLLARVNELHAELERWVSAAEKAGEPKRGEWIDEEFGAKCSCCGKYAYWSKFGITWKSPFCPLCGAKMEVQDG